jgi:glutamate synthase (NADPH/NADH) small chain
MFAALRAALLKERVVAKDPMLKFVSKPQAYPHKREAELRAEDFAEIADRYAPAAAADQASRCSQCGVPYCSVHCPLHNHIPDWLRLTAEGRLREAYEMSSLTSTMPEICGRICPQDRLCEGNCVIEFSGHDAVTIGSVEKYITDTAWEQGWVEPVDIGPSRGQSVGIIGAGPGGLTTAEYLRVAGYDVHVYDRYDRMGGLMTYGIPGFKLEKDIVMRRVQRLEDAGIHFHANFEVGRDASLDDLRAKHDAVLIATGVYKARAIATRCLCPTESDAGIRSSKAAISSRAAKASICAGSGRPSTAWLSAILRRTERNGSNPPVCNT